MKLCHPHVPAFLGLVLFSASVQAHPPNPLVGKWSGRMGDMPTLVQYRSNGTETLIMMGQKPSYIVKARYQVQGDKLVQTTIGMTSGGKIMTFAKGSQSSQTVHFRVSHGRLMLRQPDGSVFTLKKAP